MPELPEVETTLRGIETVLSGARIERLVVRDHRLRWPIPANLPGIVAGCSVSFLSRRAKYILIHLQQGSLICHLGMSGSMRIVDQTSEVRKHDHYDLVLSDGCIVRYHDPRRFGCLLWSEDWQNHPLLSVLGPEPFDESFDGDYLYELARGRRAAVKTFIMDQKAVVGVGNIYACEALFLAGISPARQARRVSRARYTSLAQHIQQVLQGAITQGGTTLRDFKQTDGQPGYFEQQLAVYGKEGQACVRCGQVIKRRQIGQRSSYYCSACQA